MHPITKIGAIADAIEIARVDKETVAVTPGNQVDPSIVAGLGRPGMMPLQAFGGAAFGQTARPPGGGGGLPGGEGAYIPPGDVVTLPVEEYGDVDDDFFELDDIATGEEDAPASVFLDTQVGVGVVPSGPTAVGPVILPGQAALPSGLVVVDGVARPPEVPIPFTPGVLPTTPSLLPTTQVIYRGVQGQVYFTIVNKAPFMMNLDIEVTGRFSDFELFHTRLRKSIKGRGDLAKFRSAFVISGNDAQAFVRDLKTEWGQQGGATIVIDVVVKWHGSVHRISDARRVNVLNASLM